MSLQRASLTVEEVDALKESLGLPGEWRTRVSTYFTIQLAYLQAHRLMDVYAIVHELRVLEGEPSLISRTKAATAFRPPLAPLWHKHHFDPQFIPKNLASHFGLLTNGHGRGRRLDDAVSAFFRENEGRTVEEVAGQLASRLIDQLFRERVERGRLTGEWIVYAPLQGTNHYLTLGSHGEAATLVDRILRNCGWEFPFLQSLLASD